MHFRRTALADYELGGVTIKKGDKVVMWYISSNSDAEVFENPEDFEIKRSTKLKPHQAFGGGGPHYCLGQMLGRAVLKAQMREIYSRMKGLNVGERDVLLSNFMNGVKRFLLPGRPRKAEAAQGLRYRPTMRDVRDQARVCSAAPTREC